MNTYLNYKLWLVNKLSNEYCFKSYKYILCIQILSKHQFLVSTESWTVPELKQLMINYGHFEFILFSINLVLYFIFFIVMLKLNKSLFYILLEREKDHFNIYFQDILENSL